MNEHRCQSRLTPFSTQTIATTINLNLTIKIPLIDISCTRFGMAKILLWQASQANCHFRSLNRSTNFSSLFLDKNRAAC